MDLPEGGACFCGSSQPGPSTGVPCFCVDCFIPAPEAQQPISLSFTRAFYVLQLLLFAVDHSPTARGETATFLTSLEGSLAWPSTLPCPAWVWHHFQHTAGCSIPTAGVFQGKERINSTPPSCPLTFTWMLWHSHTAHIDMCITHSTHTSYV